MAPGSNRLSFSLSSMDVLNSSSSLQPTTDSHHYYPFAAADNFYVTGWPSQKAQEMYAEAEILKENSSYIYTTYMQPPTPPPKLEDFFAAAGDSTETQDSSLTHTYDSGGVAAVYFVHGERQDLKTTVAGFGQAAFSANSGSEVADSVLAGGQTQSPVESGTELMTYSPCPVTATASTDNHNNNNNSNSKAIVAATDSASCKKIADTFGQRTSIYRGVTRHRWTGRYEAHLWDNSCRREGQARKGRQGGYDKEEKAARAYDLAALKYWGPTATSNFPIANYTIELEEMKHMTKQEFIASLRRKSSGFSRGASIYRGVTRHHQQGRWQARIGRVAGNKDLYLGTFATEEEAAEAYDIAAIKFRGVNAVTNFEISRYDVEAIAKSPLPIGGTAKRLKLSLEAEEKPPLSSTLQTPTSSNSNNSSSISFATMTGHTIPCGVPFDPTAPFYHNNLVHHLHPSNPSASNASGAVSSVATPMNLMPSAGEFFVWPHRSY